MIGFDQKQQQQLASYKESKETVMISNCEVKPGRREGELEILLKKYSNIVVSPTKFSLPDDYCALMSGSKAVNVSVEDIKEVDVFTHINITVKAIEVYEAENLPNGMAKQDISMGDKSGSIKFVLWEKDIGRIEKGVSYKLTNVIVSEFNNMKYLSMPKDGAMIEITADLDDVKDVDCTEGVLKISNVEVIAVEQFNIIIQNVCML